MIYIQYMHPLFKGNIFYYLSFEVFFEGKRTIIHCLMLTNLETKSYNHCCRKLRAVCLLFLLFFVLWLNFSDCLYPFHEFLVYMAWGWYMNTAYDYLCNAPYTRAIEVLCIYMLEVLSKWSLTIAIKLILFMLCLQLYKILKKSNDSKLVKNLTAYVRR